MSDDGPKVGYKPGDLILYRAGFLFGNVKTHHLLVIDVYYDDSLESWMTNLIREDGSYLTMSIDNLRFYGKKILPRQRRKYPRSKRNI